MANWCEGYLKIRGKKENIANFIKNELVSTKYNIEKNRDEYIPLELERDGDDVITFTPKKRGSLYLKNTSGFFINIKEEEKIVIGEYGRQDNLCFLTWNVEQAWAIDVQDLLVEHSKKYDIDFNIFACECLNNFEQYITVVAGRLIRYEEKIYKDFHFEAINPELGG